MACDGGKSSVRQILNIPLHPPHREHADDDWLIHDHRRDQGQRWLVIDGIGENEPSDTILFLCNHARPAVSVPGPGTQRRWEFMLLRGERAEELLDSHTISQLIAHALHDVPYEAYSSSTHTLTPPQITRQAIYTFHALIATKFSQGRAFLLGDAAHLMPPFGGQGMNSGLRDAHNLCWKLQLALQNTHNTPLLASYHTERYPHVAQMIRFSTSLGKIIMTTQRPIALLRDLVLRTIDKLPPIRVLLTEMRVKPQPRYTDGLLLKNSPQGARKLVGAFLPQPYIHTQEGKRVLLDEVLGNSFTLIRLYEEGDEAFVGIRNPIWQRLNVKFVCVQPPSSKQYALLASAEKQPDARVTYIIDIEKRISKFMGHRHDLYVLVRPDRYVMGVCSTKQIQLFEDALQKFIR